MESKYIVILISGIIFILALILSIIGLYVLVNLKRPFPNQIKIILSISLLDIVISFLGTATTIFQLIDIRNEHPIQYLLRIKIAFYIPWYLSFYLMMLDRCLSCCFPFWYRTYASSRWANITLLLSWSSLLITIPILSLTDIMQIKIVADSYIWLVLDAIYICGFIVLYGIIFHVKKRSSMITRRNAAQSENKRFIKVVSAMLITFLAFEVVPTAIMTILNIERQQQTANKLLPYNENYMALECTS